MTRQRQEPASVAVNDQEERVRLDKWLWAARFYKTRTLAVQAVDSGQVRIGDERVKPAHIVHSGDRITVRKGPLTWDVEVTGCSSRRGNAAQAALLYAESSESAAVRAQRIAELRAADRAARFPGRPTKRDRRRLEDFLNEP
jgi:ribosome-associated heat shock protein Hsp15